MKRLLFTVNFAMVLVLGACGGEEESDAVSSDELSEQIAQLEEEVDGLKKENVELKSRNGNDDVTEELELEIENMKEENEALQSEIETLKEENNEVNDEKQTLVNQVSDLEKELSSIEREPAEEAAEEDVDEEKTETASQSGDVPREWELALDSAYTYAELMSMSKAGIYDQLVSEYGENFPPEAAQYAIDNIEWDWKANALDSAETYRDMMSMSNAAVYDQLVSEYGEQFTAEEAQYAVDNLD